MAYNGWRNWETWNVALWLANDEGLYATCRAAKHGQERGRFTGPSVRDYIERHLMPNGTPDMDGVPRYGSVHWAAIARAVNEF